MRKYSRQKGTVVSWASLLLCLASLSVHPFSAAGIRPTTLVLTTRVEPTTDAAPGFTEATLFRNSEKCPASSLYGAVTTCDPSDVHIAMTLDSNYLRGSMAAIHSILKHADCPDQVFFHFIAAQSSSPLHSTLRSSFPSLRFKIYPFREDIVKDLISPSSREALQEPLNYARAYLATILESCVERVVYLDSDIVVVDDIRRLYDVQIPFPSVIAAPQYCHANFTRYFTKGFWDSGLGAVLFERRRNKPCYFNTGVMVMDLARWRAGGYTHRIERWMRMQKETRIYELGSLPPFLLEFAGDVEPVDTRWNQHGLGGDNKDGSCRSLHPGGVSLLHWSGKGKPWDRLDAGKPCAVDHLWAPYDLYRPLPYSIPGPRMLSS